MKRRILVSLIALSIFTACSPKMSEVWTKKDFPGKEFNKILVVALTKDKKAGGQIFEDAVVEALKKKGINATNSITVLPLEMRGEGVSEEQIQANVDKGNYDGILVSWLADVQTRKVSLTGPDGYQSQVGSARSYINTGYRFEFTPENYREENKYILETKLFDGKIKYKEEAIIWSGQSSITDPVSFYEGSRDYASLLVKTLTNTGIINAKE